MQLPNPGVQLEALAEGAAAKARSNAAETVAESGTMPFCPTTWPFTRMVGVPAKDDAAANADSARITARWVLPS